MASEHLEAARAGDPVALEALMREQRSQVVRYAMRLCISPEDAEDATQETLLALAHYIGALRHAAALSSWLFKAVRTHCVRLARRSVRHLLVLDGENAPPVELEGPTPEEQLVDRQLRHRIAHILADMDPALRDVIVRRDVQGETAPEAAEALGISEAALKSRLHRARGELKRRLLGSFEKTTASPSFS
jgi:RNA polymerase sigma-70 factor (ECF subfamily)